MFVGRSLTWRGARAYLGATAASAKPAAHKANTSMARKAVAKTAAVAILSPPPETIMVRAHRLACDGIGDALGHPRVWLQIGEPGFVECPYCDRRFVLGPKSTPTPGVFEDASGH